MVLKVWHLLNLKDRTVCLLAKNNDINIEKDIYEEIAKH